MSAKTFVDTNILVYAHDIDAEDKCMVARRILHELWSSRSGTLSPQVLQEFYVTITRKVAKPLSKRVAHEIVDDFSVWCIATTGPEIAAAFRIEDEAKIGFWDALLCASAVKAGAQRILSEGLNAGQKIPGIRIQNRFLDF